MSHNPVPWVAPVSPFVVARPVPSGADTPAAIAPPWSSLRALEWALLSLVPLALTLLIKPFLTAFWHQVITLWSTEIGWPWIVQTLPGQADKLWFPQGDGTFLPSTQTLVLTALALLALWRLSAGFSDRFHPLKVTLRALCLIQGVSCAFFALAPASFPYTITRHMDTVLDIGYGMMLAVGPMLALGWGILKQSLLPKILAPLGVLAYFAIMLPHKVLLHAWILAHGSVLFMPTLFMCFSALLDLWIFIAFYAWLASRLPMASQPENSGVPT